MSANFDSLQDVLTLKVNGKGYKRCRKKSLTPLNQRTHTSGKFFRPFYDNQNTSDQDIQKEM